LRHFEQLSREATITDFIPLLACRCTREELLHNTSTGLDHAA
jgi:hypothetical protein